MTDQFLMFDPPNLSDTSASTCSPGSAASSSPASSPAGPMASLSSPAVFPASLFPSLDEAAERETTAISGQRCFGLSLDEDQTSFASRMSRRLMASPIFYSTECVLTWRTSVTKSRARMKYRLAPSMRRTSETGCGLWPTVQSFDANDCQRSPDALARAKMKGGCANLREYTQALWATIRATDGEKGGPQQAFSAGGQTFPAAALSLWATPKASDGAGGRTTLTAGGGNAHLPIQARALWPTVRASENEGRTTRSAPSHGRTHGLTLPGMSGDLLAGYSTLSTSDFAAFRSGFLIHLACWLLHYPQELLHCMVLATQSSQRSPRKSSKR